MTTPSLLPLTPALISGLALFAFAASVTPGPNNTMLLASGANFGWRRTVPHALGVLVGFLGLIVLVAVGLGGVFAAFPPLHTGLKWAGAAYMLYLAVRIARSRTLGLGKTRARPMRFVEGVAFQAINPKAWAMALGSVSTYVPQARFVAGVALAIAVFGLINAPCLALWTGFGVAMRRFLDRPGVLRAFNLSMGALLALSLFPMFLERG